MHIIELSAETYRQLRQRAEEEAKTPDQMAEALLQAQLNSQHPYIEIVERYGGPRPVIKGTRVAVSDIVGYLKLGETPESLVRDILPQLTLAQIYDALSYYMTTRLRLNKFSLKITKPRLAPICVKNWVKKVTSALLGSS